MTVQAPARKPVQGKWLLLRYSNITGLWYLDARCVQERQARKKYADLMRYDHHSASFEVMHIDSVKVVYRRSDFHRDAQAALGMSDWERI